MARFTLAILHTTLLRYGLPVFALLSVLWTNAAWAVAGAPFYCDSQFYQIRSDTSGGASTNTGYLVRFPTLTSTPNNAFGGSTNFSPGLNALGYNPRDNYLYAVGTNTATHDTLYRLGQSGIEPVGQIAGLAAAGYATSTAGVFDKQGRYYLIGQGAGSNIVPSIVFRIDNIPTSGTANLTIARSYVMSATVTNVGDVAFSDAADGINGTLYGATNAGAGNVLLRMTLSDAAATANVVTATWATPSIGGIGSAFYDQPTDLFYVFNNGASTFYQITNFASGTPGAVTVTGVTPSFIPGGFVNSATDGASCIFAGAQQADIRVTKSSVPVTPVGLGQTVTFTIAVSNLGTSPAQTVTIAEALPPGLAFVSANATSGSYTPIPGSWVVPNLPVGINHTLTLVATVSAAGTATSSFVNVASVSGSNQAGTSTVIALVDPNPANNSDTATPTVSLSANLTITKTDGIGSTVAGGSTAYTVTVANLSGFNVANSVLKDPVAPGLSCTAAPTCAVVSGTATCPVVGGGAGQLSMANLQGAGVQIPLLAAGSGMAFRITCNVTATGQ
jgi:uncharacterized repeat protein (TIGR01451 family)